MGASYDSDDDFDRDYDDKKKDFKEEDSFGKKIKDINNSLDEINKNIRESAILINSYKYAYNYGEKNGRTLENYYIGQREGEQKARSIFGI